MKTEFEDMKEQQIRANEIINNGFKLNDLVEQQSFACNVPFPDNTFIQKGWECPKCGRVYSPTTPICLYCGKDKEVITTNKL